MSKKRLSERYNRKYFEAEFRALNFPRVIHHGSILVVKELLKDKKKILDLGCGLGVLANYLAGRGKEVWGIDGSQYALRQAQKYERRNLSFQLGDLEGERLPFPDKSFDGIVSLHFLEHISNLDFVLKEIKRVLSASGLVVLVVPNEGRGYRRWAFRLFFKPFLGAKRDSTHKHFFTPNSFKKLLKDYFEQVEVFTYPFPFIWLISPKLARLLAFSWGNNIFAVCQR